MENEALREEAAKFCEKYGLFNGASYESKDYLVSRLYQTKRDDWDRILSWTVKFCTPAIPEHYRFRVLEKISESGFSDSVLEKILPFLDEKTEFHPIEYLFSALGHFDADRRAELLEFTKKHFTCEDIHDAVRVMRFLEMGEDRDLENLFRESKPFLTPGLSAADRAYVMATVSSVYKGERKRLLSIAKNFVDPRMREQEVSRLILGIKESPVELWDETLEMALHDKKTNGSRGLWDILARTLPPEKVAGGKSYYWQCPQTYGVGNFFDLPIS